MQISIQAPTNIRPLRTGAIRRLTSLVLGVALLVLGVGSAWAMAASPAAAGFDAGGPALRQTHGSAPLTLPNGAPGDTVVSTTTIAYDGSTPGAVHLFAEVSGDLGPYLAVTIVRGTGSGATWQPEAGPALFDGTLAELPTGWASGIAAGRTWQPGETHSFRIAVTLLDSAAAQGRTAGATFRWETRPDGA
jgi:hypothetical protein